MVLSSQLIEAVQTGNIVAVHERLAAGDDINARDFRAKTALMYAAEIGNWPIAEALLAAGADVNLCQMSHGSGTPLEFAITSGKLEMVERLLTHGAEPSAWSVRHAAITGSLEIVAALLDKGAPATDRNPDGSNVLHALCLFGPNHARPVDPVKLCELLRRLIETGADVNAENQFRDTPLTVAVSSNSVPAVQLLLGMGAKIDAGARNALAGARTIEMGQALLAAGIDADARRIAFDRAVATNHKAMASLIAGSFSNSESADLFARLRLLDLFEQGDAVKIERAIQELAGAATLQKLGGLALTRCLRQYDRQKRLTMLRLLLKHGVDPNKGAYGEMPLVMAAGMMDLEATKLLLKAGADSNQRDGSESTALHVVMGLGDLYNERKPPAQKFDPRANELVQLLIANGADVNARGYEGRTALAVAVERYPKNIQQLLDAGADPNLGDKTGWRPLMSAGPDEALILLKSGADPNAGANGGDTALHVCVHAKKCAMLLKRGADPNARNTAGTTPLMSQAQSCRLELVELLLPATSDINALDVHGNTALLFAAFGREPAIIKRLLDAGADPAAKNSLGWTFLMCASRSGNRAGVDQALASGNPVNAQDATGLTALMMAAEMGYTEIVARLLAAGADTQLQDQKNQTAKHKAFFLNRPEIATLLD